MCTSFTGEVSSDRLTSCPGVVRATCQPNVTEIGDWLKPYEPYGSKRQTFKMIDYDDDDGKMKFISLLNTNPRDFTNQILVRKSLSFRAIRPIRSEPISYFCDVWLTGGSHHPRTGRHIKSGDMGGTIILTKMRNNIILKFEIQLDT